MPQLIRPNVTKLITKDGEIDVHISIDVNLNLTTDGLLIGVGGVAASTKEERDDDVEWQIPDFKSMSNIKFGEKKE